MTMFQMENQLQKRPRLSEPLPYRRTQHKNQLCMRFQRGACDYGDRCCFAHGNEDLKGFDKRQELIAVDENQNPRCNDKSKSCRRFMNAEKCQFGDRYSFNHIKTERTSVAISILNVDGNGEMQQRKQIPWRTRLCYRWMSTGSCRYGPKCCFAHGKSELQKQGSDDAQDYAEDAPCELVDKTRKEKADGKLWEFKWKDVEKISRVYADWINDSILVSDII